MFPEPPPTVKFTLDVSPTRLRDEARRLDRMAQALAEEQERVADTPDLVTDWTGPGARKVRREMRGIARQLERILPDLEAGARALRRLARAYDDGLEDLPALNRRWSDAVADHAADIAKLDEPTPSTPFRTPGNIETLLEKGRLKDDLKKQQATIQGDYDALVERLRTATERAASRLEQATPGRQAALVAVSSVTGVTSFLNAAAAVAGTRKALADDLPLTQDALLLTGAVPPPPEGWEEVLAAFGFSNLPAEHDPIAMGELHAELQQVVKSVEGASPRARALAVHAWASEQDEVELAMLAVTVPELVGNLEGYPYRARYAANHLRVEEALAVEEKRLAWFKDNPHTMGAWPDEEGTKRRIAMMKNLLDPKSPGQVLHFDPPRFEAADIILEYEGTIAVVMGDLDEADYVGTVVPGITNNLENFNNIINRARNIQANDPTTATIAWTGYDTPELDLSMVGTSRAEVGAQLLRDFQDGLILDPDVERTIVAHSYGTLVTSLALQAGLEVDRVVFMGSPGLGKGIRSRDDLGVPDDMELYALDAPGDLVTETSGHGFNPAQMEGIVALQVYRPDEHEEVKGHSSYTKDGTLSLEQVKGVVRGWDPRPDCFTTEEVLVPEYDNIPGVLDRVGERPPPAFLGAR